MALRQDQIARYSRHLLLPDVGMEGQEKLCSAKVLCIGTGGLGSPLGLYLAAAGVGKMGMVDFDVVDMSNLQRQIMHGESTVGVLKVDSAKARLKDMNSDVEVLTYNTRLSSENAMEIFRDYDIIVDGTDNFPTRYLANDAAVLLGKPYIYGCILRFEGQASVFDARQGPCYRCLYPLVGRLLLFDALGMKFKEMKLRKDKDCPICGENPTIKELVDYEEFCGIPQAQEAASEDDVLEVGVEEVKKMLDAKNPFTLVDVREPSEYEICKIDGSVLIPLGQIEKMNPANLNGLKTSDEIVLHCKAGVRSMKAAKALIKMGYANVKSMRGGIEEWSDQIDPSVPKY